MGITLTKQQKDLYSNLLQTAVQKSWLYRGGEAQLNAFYDPLKQAEEMIRQTGTSLMRDTEIEKAFSLAAGIPDDQFLSFDDILQRGTDAFNAAANLSAADTESILAFLEQGGAKIIRGTNEPDFIPTADGRLNVEKQAKPKKYKHLFQPRLLWLSQGLESIGVYADDLIIHVRHPDPNKLRQTPYILVEIPRHQKQIILANQRGEVTFVADDRFELSMWERLNKYQLKTLSGVTPVILRDKNLWLNNILALIQGDDGLKSRTQKINLNEDTKSPKRKTAPYSVALIIESLKATHRETGQWANVNTGLIEYGPLSNGTRTWESVAYSIIFIWKNKGAVLSCNGLTRKNCPYINLSDLKDQNGFNNDYKVQDIIDSLIATHKETGQWVSREGGVIEYGPLANGSRTWMIVNGHMTSLWGRNDNGGLSASGLTRENCIYKSLSDLKEQNKFVDHYKVQDIIDSLIATYQKTGQWPKRETGLIEYGPLANSSRTWGSVEASIKSIWRDKKTLISCNGLTRENCPYSTFASLKEAAKIWVSTPSNARAPL